MTKLIPFASLVPVPWKNGSGNMTDIAAGPPGAQCHAFDWRISLATITQDSAFSLFPGVDRTLALLEGPGMVLDVDDGRRFVLGMSGEESMVVEFDGESAIRATLNGGATLDFNVMTRRAVCHHKFGQRRLSGHSQFSARGGHSLLFLADGESLSVSSELERIGMVRFDAVMFDSAAVWTLEADDATIFIVDIVFDLEAV